VWGLTCAVLVWCSQTAIPVCAVCGLVLLVCWIRDWRAVLKVIPGGVILGVSVALDWSVMLRRQSADGTLQSFWREAGGYPPLHQTIPADVHWLGTAVISTEQFFCISWPFVALGLMACGLIVALGRRHFPGLLLSLPIAAGVAMAVTDHYPLDRRLALYLYPVAVMLLAAPLALADRPPSTAAAWRRPAAVMAAAAALIAVTAPGVALGLGKSAHPDEGVTGRQAVAFAGQHHQPGDLVLAQTGLPSVLTMNFYGPRFRVREKGLFYLARPRRNGTCADPFSRHPRVTRVWLIFAEFSVGQPPNRNQIYLSRMAVYGKPVLSYNGQDGAAAVLFDLSKTRPRKPLPRHPLTSLDCIGIRPPWDGPVTTPSS
jgi:hypothetical protein